MSNTARSIKGILAVATLAAGFGSLGVGAATARTHCESREPVSLLEGTSGLASLCDERLGLRATTAATKMTPRADNEMLTTMDQVARRTGLAGLSHTTAVLSFADMGGAAAGAGVPRLPSGPRDLAARSLRPATGLTGGGAALVPDLTGGGMALAPDLTGKAPAPARGRAARQAAPARPAILPGLPGVADLAKVGVGERNLTDLPGLGEGGDDGTGALDRLPQVPALPGAAGGLGAAGSLLPAG